MKLNPLSSEEDKIIARKGTEAPHSGEYDAFDETGLYTCRRCEAWLFRSSDKFDGHCGWPSFDDAVLGAVESSADTDGQRTEITCRRCGAHLGHVFLHEKFTPKDTRYCVNSLSMKFVAETSREHITAQAVVGGGCFWCTEAVFKMIKGVISVVPGYAGGTGKNPSYAKVCTGQTGHAEVVRIEYDPSIIAYEGLLDVFFATHDPTTLNKQGNDLGSQYRSIILHLDDLQKEIAENYIAGLGKQRLWDSPIVTEVKPLEEFFEAEDYHHDYYDKNPDAAYCQSIISPKLAKSREKLTNYLKP